MEQQYLSVIDEKAALLEDVANFLWDNPETAFTEFKSAATSLFGSGYTWLVQDGDKLKIVNMANADTPIAHNMKPILTLDVWEHSYYLDYKNKRADFIDNFLNNLIDWNFVAENLRN